MWCLDTSILIPFDPTLQFDQSDDSFSPRRLRLDDVVGFGHLDELYHSFSWTQFERLDQSDGSFSPCRLDKSFRQINSYFRCSCETTIAGHIIDYSFAIICICAILIQKKLTMRVGLLGRKNKNKKTLHFCNIFLWPIRLLSIILICFVFIWLDICLTLSLWSFFLCFFSP